jgi:hypothetical protein
MSISDGFIETNNFSGTHHTTAQMALGSDFCTLGLLDMKLRAWTLRNSDLLLLFHHRGTKMKGKGPANQ